MTLPEEVYPVAAVREIDRRAIDEAGIAGYELMTRAERWARHFDLEGLLERPFHHLSIGQKRRVELAASFAATPSVLLLDEPTNGLDLRGLTQLEEALLHQKARLWHQHVNGVTEVTQSAL